MNILDSIKDLLNFLKVSIRCTGTHSNIIQNSLNSLLKNLKTQENFYLIIFSKGFPFIDAVMLVDANKHTVFCKAFCYFKSSRCVHVCSHNWNAIVCSTRIAKLVFSF